ncbi:MAG TPA: cytochrome c [Casimicrobiaceae bacterium]|nr:cytochrome c [Casimicrobiaceae bacterium]
MSVHATSRTVASTLALGLCWVAALAFSQAQPAPFAAGKVADGRTIVDRDCVGCHAQRYAGDADQIYRRADRRVRTPAQLLAQVQACNVELGKGYFPEEEEHIAAYLNLEFYKFGP